MRHNWKKTQTNQDDLDHEVEVNPDTDPIVVTHEFDDSIGEDELIIHTTIDKDSITHKENEE